MSKLLKVTLLLVLAVGSFGLYSGAQDSPEALATKHVLEGTYINNGNFNGSVSAGTWTPVDTKLTVPCPGTSGTCTIEADMWVDNWLSGEASSNSVTICLYVDDVQTSGCAYATSETPPDGSHNHASTSQPLSGLAPGNHTVQTYFYSDYGAFLEYYAVNYRVYKP